MSDEHGPAIPEYRLCLDVDPAALRWTGTVGFDAPVGHDQFELDCDGPRVSAVTVGSEAVGFSVDPAAHRLSFEVPPGARRDVVIDFAGAVETKNLFGLYRSRHGTDYLLTTHCEPTGTRKIFPCIDRPDRKARIALTVRAPEGLDVISNTPVRTSRSVDGRREWTFEPTPEMSTYLFYLGIGHFDFREDRALPVTVRVATPPGRGASSAWALQCAGRILRAYEEYYGIPYPLPKLDLIAVAEHAFGAMENWGAISFQESRLLVDGASNTFATQDVFTTAAHEIAHQWFGNLVTMSSWDDIWLNESFAALMETKITDALEPSFDPWCDFIVRTMGKAAAVDGDSLRSTHPVRSHVDRPEEMSQIFDEISYGKGSSVLAMLDRYLGEQRFRAGVTDYLQKFRYRNAETEDLFSALERASGEPVAAVAGPWIDRAGFPLVTARSGRDGVVLSQSRFAYLGAPDDPPWPIPMVVEVDGQTERFLFDGREHRLRASPSALVLLNPGSIGFYRVHYDRPLFDRLLAELPARPALDAWAVLSDLAAFVLSGHTDWATYARATEAFAETSDRLTAETLGGSLASFAFAFPEVPAVVETAKQFLRRQVGHVGVDRRDGEPRACGVMRDYLTLARVRVDADFANELSGRFGGWGQLDPDLRGAVAVARVRGGGGRGFDEVRRAFDAAPTAIEALRLVRALVWSPEPERVREVLDLAIAGGINRAHVFSVAYQAGCNPAGKDVAWEWLDQNLDQLAEMFRGSGYLPLVLESVLPMVGRSRLADVRRRFEGRDVPEATRGLSKGLERLEIFDRLARRLR